MNKNLQNAIGLTDEEIKQINDVSILEDKRPKTIVKRIEQLWKQIQAQYARNLFRKQIPINKEQMLEQQRLLLQV